MGLTDIYINSFYDSEEDDILNDFYLPVLSECKEYRRLTGFFSSTSLSIAARGIRGLIENSGHMKIISGAVLRKEDVKAIKEGTENPSNVIENLSLNDLDSIENEFIKNHIRALSWLIANKKLEIKIALVKDKYGDPIDVETLEKNGIFHQKVGIFIDKDKNMIAFSGSVNETAFGWKENIEEFNVFRSWIKDEYKYFKNQYEKFEKYWSGKKYRVEVMDVPDAIKKRLIKMAPNRYEKINLEYVPKQEIKKRKVLEPWTHQKNAIKALRNNKYKGIFKMATGTGKTYTAFLALEHFYKDVKENKNRIVIVVSSHNLLQQWLKDLREFFPHKNFILNYDSKTSESDKKFAWKVWMSNFEKEELNTFLIITIKSLKNFTLLKSFTPDFLIADEVHTYGTENNIEILKHFFSKTKFRLGLSATPERYYDLNGTNNINNFFGPIVFEYGIKDAQNDGVLANYYYYPYLVNLTEEEEIELEEISLKIRKKVAINYEDEISEKEGYLLKNIENLLIKRAKIIKRAESKFNELKRILSVYMGKLKQCIVYCLDTNQLNTVQTVFDKLKLENYIKYHSKTPNREAALNLFKRKNCNFILSINCLDQGVNIPSCESFIMLSSSANPREYIQRRGRVLRNPINKVKPMVRIFDVFAFPFSVNEIYREMIITHLARAWEFIEYSETPEARLAFQNIMDSYGISDSELEEIIGGF
ncbi:MAG TPA: DEAD/DEAH box helicase family protein [Candidatus Paceibacterota bacterium]|nr:DEAD/DEAH box helicase family protein [Candidatus Paceibacterota bacterium]